MTSRSSTAYPGQGPSTRTDPPGGPRPSDRRPRGRLTGRRLAARGAVGHARGGAGMKLSARNVLKGKVLSVKKGATTAHVRIDIGHGVVVTSSITNEAVRDLGLRKGDTAYAVIKASNVIVAKD